MTTIAKETLEGFSFIAAEIHHAADHGDFKRLKRLEDRLTALQQLVAEREKNAVESESEALWQG